jgi:hypothetical protein
VKECTETNVVSLVADDLLLFWRILAVIRRIRLSRSRGTFIKGHVFRKGGAFLKKDNFGDRMKEYENVFRQSLPRRLPLILRIDGCHFHTYTRGMDKPFDIKLTNAFWETCKFIAKNIMGCKMVYHQSDEISISLPNYDKLTTESWFDNNIQNWYQFQLLW